MESLDDVPWNGGLVRDRRLRLVYLRSHRRRSNWSRSMRRLHAALDTLWPLLVALAWLGFGLALLSGCYPYVETKCDSSRMRCELEPVAFAPAPGLEADTSAALARISKATDRPDLYASPRGVPIVFMEDLEHTIEDGVVYESCAQTSVMFQQVEPRLRYAQWIAIDPTPPARCPPTEDTIVHELIHALSPLAQHSDSGVFKDRPSDMRIDSASLEALCGGFDCHRFQVEE